jgi:hypothetical protein
MTRLPQGYLEMGRADYAGLDIDTQRAVFAELREIVRHTMGTGQADFYIRAAYSADYCPPVDWIMAIFRVTCGCERCRGTGTYSWGDQINGRMPHSAPCACCGGDGVMTFDDMRLGRAYDKQFIQRACR